MMFLRTPISVLLLALLARASKHLGSSGRADDSQLEHVSGGEPMESKPPDRNFDIANERVEGEWGPVFDLKVVPIHAMLVPPGNKVLFYGTNDKGNNHVEGGNNIYYEVWDLDKGVVQDEAHQLLDHTTDIDIFCSNMNIDPSTGNVIITGGDDRTLLGIKNAMEYDFKTGLVRNHPTGDMHYARWYHTSINLPNGDIFIVGGNDQEKMGNAIPEVWSPDTGFRKLKRAKVPIIVEEPGPPHWWYPHAYVNSNGEIILIMPRNRNSAKRWKAHVYRVGTDGKGSITKIGRKPFRADVLSPSIMFRTDRVLMLADNGRLWVADISDGSSSPKWERQDARVRHGRTNGSMAMLPDGRVSIVGGCKSQEEFGTILDEAVRDIQIWDPVTDTLFDGDEETRARLYHSTSLILPDGRLYSGGGGTPGPQKNLNGQLFSPDYLLQTSVARVSIVDCPKNIKSGESFVLVVDDTSRIVKVTATKSGAITHTRNCDTRWLDLDFDVVNGTDLRVHAEQNANIMIGGLWMVNVLDDNGVPSEASIVGVNMATLD